MAENELIEILDDCINHLNAGESLDDCLRRYPQHAARLRDLLTVGQDVHRATTADVAADQSALRDPVLARMRGARSGRRSTRNWPFMLAGVAAAFVVVFVAALALFTPSVGNIFSNITSALDQNYVMTLAAGRPTAEPTLLVVLPSPTSPGAVTLPPEFTPRPSATVTVTTTPPPTMTIDADPAAVATSVMLMSPMPSQEINAEGIVLTATALSELLVLPTATVLPAGTMMPTAGFVSTALPGVGGGESTQVAMLLTATISPSYTPAPMNVQVIPLSAGEIDDNAKWDDYLLYRRNYLSQYPQSVRDFDVTERQIITVHDQQGLPILGALVQVYAGQTLVSESRTYATGQTLFFPNARAESQNTQSFRVVVQKGATVGEFTLDPQRGPMWNVTLAAAGGAGQGTQLDVLFLLDATGSMADEISNLQNNILAISAQIDALPGNVNVRYGLVHYRDRGDAYVTQTFDFVSGVAAFQAALSGVSADGGGDTPESLNEGLHRALADVNWRGDDAVKLIFLVADAAPHLDYPDDYDYVTEMISAAGKGIKIHPIASSGLTPDGEFIFRQLAQTTMGHFIFLTYAQGASGAPGESRPDLEVGEPANPAQQEPGDYTVEQLDKLVLRLITDELAALNQRVNQQGVGVPLTPIPPTQTSGFTPGDDLDWTRLLGLIVLGIIIGYAVQLRPAKRKNDDLVD